MAILKNPRIVMLPILGSLFLSLGSCRQLRAPENAPENSGVAGIPTDLGPSGVEELVDLSTYREAGPKEYHQFLRYLQEHGQRDQALGRSLEDSKEWMLYLRDGLLRKGHPFSHVPWQELYAIHLYTGDYYSPINGSLWDVERRAMRPNLAGFMKTLASGLNKLPNFIGVVRRGSKLTSEYVEKKYVKGTVVSEDTFISTAYNRGWYGTVNYIIHSKTGKRVDWISDLDTEYEVAFPPGHSFYVHDVRARPDDFYENEEPVPGYIVEMEQVFPDTDTPECCSLDEMWDPKISACRYRTLESVSQSSSSAGTKKDSYDPELDVRFPYEFTRKFFGRAICHPDHVRGRQDWTPATCASGDCYPGFPDLGIYLTDYRQCRKGKRFHQEISLYDACSKTKLRRTSKNYDWAVKEAWDAMRYSFDYENSILTRCIIRADKVILERNEEKQEISLTAVGDQSADSTYWKRAKVTAFRATKDKAFARVEKVPGQSMASFYHVALPNRKRGWSVLVHSEDYETGETKSMTRKTFGIPAVDEIVKSLDRICDKATAMIRG